MEKGKKVREKETEMYVCVVAVASGGCSVLDVPFRFGIVLFRRWSLRQSHRLVWFVFLLHLHCAEKNMERWLLNFLDFGCPDSRILFRENLFVEGLVVEIAAMLVRV